MAADGRRVLQCFREDAGILQLFPWFWLLLWPICWLFILLLNCELGVSYLVRTRTTAKRRTQLPPQQLGLIPTLHPSDFTSTRPESCSSGISSIKDQPRRCLPLFPHNLLLTILLVQRPPFFIVHLLSGPNRTSSAPGFLQQNRLATVRHQSNAFVHHGSFVTSFAITIDHLYCKFPARFPAYTSKASHPSNSPLPSSFSSRPSLLSCPICHNRNQCSGGRANISNSIHKLFIHPISSSGNKPLQQQTIGGTSHHSTASTHSLSPVFAPLRSRSLSRSTTFQFSRCKLQRAVHDLMLAKRHVFTIIWTSVSHLQHT